MLLFRDSRLWYCLLFQTATLKPTPYVHIHVKRIVDTHYGRLVSHCFGTSEFTRFRIAKTKRLRRFFQYVLALLRRQATGGI